MTDVRVTSQWVEEIHTSTATPDVNVTSQWVEEIHTSTAAPDVNVTSQWVEYITNLYAPSDVDVTSQWVEYISKRPPTAFVTTEYAEVINQPTTVNAGVTQEYAEVISTPDIIKIGVTQEYAETISKRIDWVFTTTEYVEVIARVWESIFPARVSVAYAETISYRGPETKAFITNEYAEIITKLDLTRRVTNVYAETINHPAFVNAGITQLCAEVIRKSTGTGDSININAPC